MNLPVVHRVSCPLILARLVLLCMKLITTGALLRSYDPLHLAIPRLRQAPTTQTRVARKKDGNRYQKDVNLYGKVSVSNRS